MAYLAVFHWGWLTAALLLGFCMGWIAVVHRGPGVSTGWARGLAVLALALIGLALAREIPGRWGYWLDMFLVMFGLYILGCAIGSVLRAWVVSRTMPAPSGS